MRKMWSYRYKVRFSALPGGTAQIALGADYRSSSFDYHPDSIFITGDTLSYGTSTAASGSQSAKEVFGELLLPLLKDVPFAQDLSIDLGARYSKYDTFAGKGTWKADASWSPVTWHSVPWRLLICLSCAKSG